MHDECFDFFRIRQVVHHRQQKCFQMLGTVEQNTWTQLKKHAIELGAWQGVITSSPKKGAAAKREGSIGTRPKCASARKSQW